MENETEEKRIAREADLKRICAPLGFSVDGSIVTVMVGSRPIKIDASSIPHSVIVPGLIYSAYQQGIALGLERASADLEALKSV